jgi:hypothetical protein
VPAMPSSALDPGLPSTRHTPRFVGVDDREREKRRYFNARLGGHSLRDNEYPRLDLRGANG